MDAVDFSEAMVREAKLRFKDINFMEADAEVRELLARRRERNL